ncbi:MAG: hypothetical protein M3Z22_07455 [Verrucomicrobiota bacterium]|nr:hypothetical protein [Verrucomicrobiota bacterium]
MKVLFTALFAVATLAVSASRVCAAEMAEGDKKFLAQYEQVRAALAADDLALTQKAAAEMGEEGAALAKCEALTTARTEFAKLSERAIKLAHGESGYYVMNCPMLKKDWVQTNQKISNPYAGRAMLTCGMIKP